MWAQKRVRFLLWWLCKVCCGRARMYERWGGDPSSELLLELCGAGEATRAHIGSEHMAEKFSNPVRTGQPKCGVGRARD